MWATSVGDGLWPTVERPLWHGPSPAAAAPGEQMYEKSSAAVDDRRAHPDDHSPRGEPQPTCTGSSAGG
jgi:hypothetical protein